MPSAEYSALAEYVTAGYFEPGYLASYYGLYPARIGAHQWTHADLPNRPPRRNPARARRRQEDAFLLAVLL